MPKRLELRFLGGFSAAFDGVAMPGAPPSRTVPLLAYLLLRRDGAPVSRASLATILWPDEMAEEARTNLRRHLQSLTNALPQIGVPWILAARHTLAWNPAAPAWADILAFKEMAKQPECHDEAIALFRDDFLDSLEDLWILEQRDELRGTYISLCHDVAQVARRLRDYDRALLFLNRILVLNEWREDVVRLMMAIRHDAGDRAGALSDFQAFAARLKAEIHVPPMAETVALRDAILAGAIAGSTAAQEPSSARRLSTQHAFVGRSRERESLQSAWLRAGQGHGSSVLISGVAGIGKSALVAQLVETAQAQGGRIVLGATSSPEAFPYEPVVLALRSALPLILEARIDRPWLAALARVMPELHSVRDDLVEKSELSIDDARSRLTEAVIRVISALARARPLILVLEDIHWATGGTLSMVEALARRIGALPVLLVATFRSDEADASQSVAMLRRRLQSEHHAVAISLSNLAEAEVAELADAVATSDDRAALLQAVYELSEGHPLFVTQLLQRYGEYGNVPSREGALVSLDDAIGERISRLDNRSTTVVEAAAVVGNSFSVELVAQVLGFSERDVLEVFSGLFDRAILRESGMREFGYMFTHALIQSSIYNRISHDMLAARHRRAATVLQQLGVDRQDADIARHWELAGERVAAHAAYMRAASAALEVFSRDTAQDCASKAVALAGSERERFEALAMLAHAYQGSAHVKELDRCVSELEDVASLLSDGERFTAASERERVSRQIGERDARARAVDVMLTLGRAASDARKIAIALEAAGSFGVFVSDANAALQHFADAIVEATRAGDAALALRIQAQYAQLLSRRGDFEAAAAIIAEARRLLSADDTAGRMALLSCEASCALDTDDSALGLRVGNEMVQLSKSVGNVELEARGRLACAAASSLAFEIARARREYRMGIELLELVGNRTLLTSAVANLGLLEFDVGRFSESAALLERAVSISREIGNRRIEGASLGFLAEIARDRGEYTLASELIGQSLLLLSDGADVRRLTFARVANASILMLSGSVDEGKVEMRAAISARREINNASRSLGQYLCTMIETAMNIGDVAFAAEGAAELRTLIERFPTGATDPAREAAAVARVALVEGDAREAERWIAVAQSDLKERIGQLEEPTDREAYLSQAFIRALPQIV